MQNACHSPLFTILGSSVYSLCCHLLHWFATSTEALMTAREWSLSFAVEAEWIVTEKSKKLRSQSFHNRYNGSRICLHFIHDRNSLHWLNATRTELHKVLSFHETFKEFCFPGVARSSDTSSGPGCLLVTPR